MKKDTNDATIEFLDARTYFTTEWFNSKKKYRTVFDYCEIDKIYLEIELFNLLYQKEDQEIEVVILLKEMEDDKEYEDVVGKVKLKQEVKKDEKFIYIRQRIEEIGQLRHYVVKKNCEIYVNDKLGKILSFYVNNIGQVTEKYNPYFDVVEVRLFNGDDIESVLKVTPLKVFKRDEIEYMYVDVIVKNKVPRLCYVEFTFRYMDVNGYVKGEASLIQELLPEDGEIVHFYAGWGRDEPSSEIYPQDIYFIDIIFLGQIIARVEAIVGSSEEEGSAPYWIGNPFLTYAENIPHLVGRKSSESGNYSIQPVLDKLNSMVGLNEFKEQIHELITFLKYVNLKKKRGLNEDEKINLHTVLAGNAGVGKSSIVKLLGELYAVMGLLSKGHVVEVTRTDLIAEYVGQSAPQTVEIIEKARGGILFVNEAHELEKNNYGLEALDVLIKELTDGRGDIVIVFGGYPDKMENFLKSNPALKSCFGYYFNIPDYTPDQLMQILINKAGELNLFISPDAQNEFRNIILNQYRDRDNTFGNARFVIYLLNEARKNMAKRIMNYSDLEKLETEKLSTIELSDVLEIKDLKRSEEKLYLKIDEPLLQMALAELNNLIGLSRVKKEINELVKLTRYYNEIGKPFHKALSLHYVFAGNPGTGKTTVARLLGDIFRALGVLQKGHMVEVDRSELVAGYVGQTAIKTENVIHSAINGILFIDEAYSLTSTSEEDFGKEAIEVLVKEMEDHRNELSVVVAGYTDLMREFINSNPGLKSRFTKTLYFEDYSDEELVDIAKVMLKEEELRMDDEAEKKLLELVKSFPRGKNFGNARTVRKIVDLIIKKHSLRVAEIPVSERTANDIHFIKEADIPQMIDVTDF